MLLEKQVEEEINSEDPWEEWGVSRKRTANFLTPIVASTRQPFVISLNSSFGSGKTFFVKRWKADLDLKGFKTAYFNAWETDFSNDPLSAFMSVMKQKFLNDKDGEEKIKTLAKKAAGFMRHKALPILLKGLGRKIVGKDGVSEIIEEFGLESEEVSNVLSSVAIEALNSQLEAEKSMKEFKIYLEELALECSKTNVDEENSENLWNNKEDREKLIIFIDELDRCRPTYAVEVLETIKHFFSVPGLLFVISVDIEQLKNSFASVYGPKLECDGYLRRFIDWEFNLPNLTSEEYITNLFLKFNFDDIYAVSEVRDTFIHILSETSIFYKLELRDLNRVFTHLNLLLRNMRNESHDLIYAIAFLVVVRIKNSDDYEKLTSNKKVDDDYFKELKIKYDILLSKIFSDSGAEKTFEAMFLSWNLNKNYDASIPGLYPKAIEFFGRYRLNSENTMLMMAKDKIELAKNYW